MSARSFSSATDTNIFWPGMNFSGSASHFGSVSALHTTDEDFSAPEYA